MPQAFTREQPRVAPITATPILVEIEAEYIPLLFSALEKYHNRYFWVSDGDYSAGLQGILRLERALLTNMSESIVTELQRIYRLIDTSFNGTQYTAAPAGEGLPPTITPALPPVPPASTTEANALRAHVGRLWSLAENAHTGATFSAGAGIEGGAELPASLSWAARLLGVQGVRDTGWITPDQPVTLKMLLEASRINSTQDKDTIRNATTTLADTVTAGGSIADAIGDFLTAAADAGTDGGVIAVQLATSAALLLQLQRINVALNGNPAVFAPTDGNILFALRGDNVITSTNNVLSLLALQKTAAELAAARLYDGGTRLTNAELLALVANRTQQTAGNTSTAADRLLAIQRLISQDSPLAEGNDLYNVLIAISDNTRRAAECCEDGAGTGENDPPASAGDCAGWGTYIRMSNYVFVADVDDGLGGDLQTLYDIEFDFSGEPWFQAAGTSSGRVYYEIAGTDDLELEFCHARNFTGPLIIRSSGPDFGQTIAEATDTSYTVAPDTGQVDEIHGTIDIGDGPGESRYFGFSAQFPRGDVPSKNIWFKARYVVS